MRIRNIIRILLMAAVMMGISGLSAQDQDLRDKELKMKLARLMDSCQYRQACLVADHLLGKDSLNVQMLILKGRALAADFKIQQAKDVFTIAFRVDSTNIVTLFELVNACRQLGDFKQAISYGRKLADIYPENSFFTVQLANLYYGMDDFRKAKAVLLDLYLHDSLNTYVLKQLANSCNALQQADSAIPYYKKYLDIVPYDAGITAKLTNLYIRKRNYEAGLCLTEMFLAHDSNAAGILRLNAYCTYLLKDYETAAGKFHRCTLLGDESEFTLKYLGLSWYRKERYDLAEPWLRLAYKADTADAEVCFYYGVSAYRSALTDTGIVYLEKTLKLLMPDPEFLNTLYVELAAAYSENGQADTALTILKSAFEDNPADETLAFKIAYQYDYYLRKPYLALPYYKQFIRLCPESEKQEVNLPLQRSYYSFAVSRIKEIK